MITDIMLRTEYLRYVILLLYIVEAPTVQLAEHEHKAELEANYPAS